MPGATCCQRKSHRMNSAGATGSICLRSVPSVSRWIRAKSRLSHHSVSLLSGCAKRPRRTAPLASILKKVLSISTAGTCRVSPNPPAVTGPQCAIQPAARANRASSREAVFEPISGREDAKRVSGKINTKSPARSALTQYFNSPT